MGNIKTAFKSFGIFDIVLLSIIGFGLLLCIFGVVSAFFFGDWRGNFLLFGGMGIFLAFLSAYVKEG